MLVGKNVVYKVTVIGSNKINMFDDIALIFSNVRHVLDMRKIWISSNTLDGNGCR